MSRGIYLIMVGIQFLSFVIKNKTVFPQETGHSQQSKGYIMKLFFFFLSLSLSFSCFAETVSCVDLDDEGTINITRTGESYVVSGSIIDATTAEVPNTVIEMGIVQFTGYQRRTFNFEANFNVSSPNSMGSRVKVLAHRTFWEAENSEAPFYGFLTYARGKEGGMPFVPNNRIKCEVTK